MGIKQNSERTIKWGIYIGFDSFVRYHSGEEGDGVLYPKFLSISIYLSLSFTPSAVSFSLLFALQIPLYPALYWLLSLNAIFPFALSLSLCFPSFCGLSLFLSLPSHPSLFSFLLSLSVSVYIYLSISSLYLFIFSSYSNSLTLSHFRTQVSFIFILFPLFLSSPRFLTHSHSFPLYLSLYFSLSHSLISLSPSLALFSINIHSNSLLFCFSMLSLNFYHCNHRPSWRFSWLAQR